MKLPEKNSCTGCSACQAVCITNAICMQSDEEGFLHPVVDTVKCIACGRCERVCPVENPPSNDRLPLQVYAAMAKDDELRLQSSSGGVFSILARKIIAKGGIVFGAGFDKSDWHVTHKSAETEEELTDLRGSKYVQSEIGDTYKRVRQELEKQRFVLFSGTPCQIAGLKNFLAINAVDESQLLFVEVVCHAAPSPFVWQKYLQKRCAAAKGSKIKRISSRQKLAFGWKRYSMSLAFANDIEYLSSLSTDPFLRVFLSELVNRPSCHNCAFRHLRSGADLTIADYWRVHEKFPEFDDDKGTSLVLVNTAKAGETFAAIAEQLKTCNSDWEDAVRTNPALIRSAMPNAKRAMFFAAIQKGEDFDKVTNRYLRRPLVRRAGSFVKRSAKKILAKLGSRP